MSFEESSAVRGTMHSKGDGMTRTSIYFAAACLLCGIFCMACGKTAPASETDPDMEKISAASYESGELVAMARAYYESISGLGTPVKLDYRELGEIVREYEITDSEVLASCMEALRGLVIGQETDLRAMDDGEIYSFEFQDGSTWTVSFDGGNLEKNGKCYETEGYDSLKQQIRQYAENCDITE